MALEIAFAVPGVWRSSSRSEYTVCKRSRARAVTQKTEILRQSCWTGTNAGVASSRSGHSVHGRTIRCPRISVFSMSAGQSSAETNVLEKRTQEHLQERLTESRERVNYLTTRITARESEKLIGVTEDFLRNGPGPKQDADTYRETSVSLASELGRCLKDLDAVEKENSGSIVDMAYLRMRIEQLLPSVESAPDRVEEMPEVKEEEDSSNLPPVEKVRKKVIGVGQGFERRVGAFVREDGSIDFPQIRSTAQMSLDKTSEIWARLNGVAPEGASLKQAYEDSPVTWSLRTEIEVLEKRLTETSRSREQKLRKEDQLGKLVKAREFREMDDEVSMVRRTLAVRVLELEMERIFLYLKSESESIEDFIEERLLIAEFGQLDERLAVLKVFIDENEVLLLDDDELGELAGDITFMKSRVGLENDFYTTTLDWPKAKRIFSDGIGKMKEGGDFFWRGLRLLGGDIVYGFQLVRKAAMGSILTPREVRTLRRTGRDIISFIPFSIILILPLSPIGHVLVFSFIQRVFPDFFPTTFSERRQRLMKRYETMRKTITTDGTVASTVAPPVTVQNATDQSLDDVHLAE